MDQWNDSNKNVFVFYSFLASFVIHEFSRHGPVQHTLLTKTKGKSKKPSNSDSDMASTIELFFSLLCSGLRGKVYIKDQASIQDSIALLFQSSLEIFSSEELLKSKALRCSLTDFQSCLLSHFGLQESTADLILRTVLSSDKPTLGEALVDLLKKLSGENETLFGSLMCTLLSKIGNLEQEEFGRDSSSSKCIAELLVSLSSENSSIFRSHLSVLLPLLELDNYTIRNCIIQVIGNVIRYEFELRKQNADLAPSLALFELLEQRILDSNSYCRSKVIQVWTTLIEARCISRENWNRICRLTCDRMNDKSLSVRKASLHLLCSMVSYNPFSPCFSNQFLVKLKPEFEEKEGPEFSSEIQFFVTNLNTVLSVSTRFFSGSTPLLLEYIQFVRQCCLFEIPKAMDAFDLLLPYCCAGHTPEESVLKSMLDCIEDVFLKDQSQYHVSSLCSFTGTLTLVSQKCLLDLFDHLVRRKSIGQAFIALLIRIICKLSEFSVV